MCNTHLCFNDIKLIKKIKESKAQRKAAYYNTNLRSLNKIATGSRDFWILKQTIYSLFGVVRVAHNNTNVIEKCYHLIKTEAVKPVHFKLVCTVNYRFMDTSIRQTPGFGPIPTIVQSFYRNLTPYKMDTL